MRIKKQTERWFEVEGDPDKARILIKHLNPGEVSDIMDGVFRQTIVYKNVDGGKDLQPEFTQETDKRKDREMTLTAAVAGWENFFDRDDKPLKCTPANVIRASREIEGFNDLVTDFRKRLSEDLQKEEAKEEKGLEKN